MGLCRASPNNPQLHLVTTHVERRDVLVRCGGCTYWVPNRAKSKPAENSQLGSPGNIVLGEDGVDIYLSHCFHQGKKNSQTGSLLPAPGWGKNFWEK